MSKIQSGAPNLSKSFRFGAAGMLLVPLIAVVSCTSQTTTNPTTGATNITQAVSPLGMLGEGAAFTVLQGVAQAELAKNPTKLAQAQTLLKTMQAAFVQWSANPTPANAEAVALQAAEQSLANYLISQGVSVTT